MVVEQAIKRDQALRSGLSGTLGTFPIRQSPSGIPLVAGVIVTIVTQTGTSPSPAYKLPGGYNAIRVWTGETPVTEPWFFLYVNRSGSVAKIKMNRFEARVITVPSGTVGLATSDGRTVYVSPDAQPASLGTSFPVSGTANADAGGPPIWSPSAAHITLPVGQNQYELVGSGTERIVFVSEYDGATWSPARWLRLPASGSLRMHATYRQIAVANYDGATVSVNGPTGTVIGGTSAASSLTMPSVTGTTRNATDVASLKTAIAAAVAGDEIVLAAGTYNLDVNITAASFTSNNGVGGRIGAEGILIRGATSDRTLYIIGCAANGQGAWSLVQTAASLKTGFKDITFNFAGSNTSEFTVSRGRFSIQNCRFTGTIGAGLDCFNGSGSTTTNGLYLDCYKCQADTSIADCWNFNDGNSTANLVRLIDCVGHTSGANSNDQCLTSHNGLPLYVYGGSYYNAAQNVIANGTPSTPVTYLHFVRTYRGARNAVVTNCACFGCLLETMLSTGVSWSTPLSVASVIKAGVRENTAINSVIEGNLFNNESAIANYYAYFPSVSTLTVFERNVLIGFAIALRFNSGTGPGNQSANRNTAVSCGFAIEKSTTFTTAASGNISRLSSTRGVSVDATGMANLVVSYNTWDGAADADYVPGSNDVAATAALDSNYLPTAGGNCDGTGNPAAIDWVGGTDYVGFLLEISSVTRDRGARCRPRIIANAEMVPDIW